MTLTYFALRNTDSCQHTGVRLIGYTQEIADCLDQSQQTNVIVMDLRKAFDKVDHHKLVQKLKHMGVNPYITTWIKDFLHSLPHNKLTRICTKSSGRLSQSRTLGKRMVYEI